MYCSTPGLPVHYQLPEFTQTHVHRVGDAIQPSPPLSSPSSPAFNISENQGLFQWIGSLHQSIGVSTSASVLPMNTQDWFPLGWTGWISCSPRDSRESSPTAQFKSINSVLSFLYSPTLTSIHDYWKNHSLTWRTFVDKVMSLLFNMLSRFFITFLSRPYLKSHSEILRVRT